MNALLVSSVMLWIIVLALLVVCLALARQIGILHERVAPMGALVLDQGPQVGDQALPFVLRTLDGSQIAVGAADADAGKGVLLFFLSPSCPVCKKLLPIIKDVSRRERGWLRVVLASDGEQPEHLAFVKRTDLREFPYVLSAELGKHYQVAKLPYAVLIGGDGRIQAKGLVNSREQIESLFTARDLAVSSIQEYLAARA